jgi:hypothetical protein
MTARALPRARSVNDYASPVALVLGQGLVLLIWPSVLLIAIGLWWNANTISHQFIHRPFFRTRAMNTAFSFYLSLLLGFPQSFWRARHLAHHASVERPGLRGAWFRGNKLEFAAVIALWSTLLLTAPGFTLRVYAPGFLIGLGLCWLQGHYEHARGTVSHYGRLYNLLFFNDGHHAEHHSRPGAHWRDLPGLRTARTNSSRWPAVLRWLECADLNGLERIVLRWPVLQRFVLDKHERAFGELIDRLPPATSIGIVGGGLFPRTALVLQKLLPHSSLVLIDQSEENLEVARRLLGKEVEFVHEYFEPGTPCDLDLIVIPLAFIGDREAFYRQPPAPAVLVHDWIWRRRGTGVVVSLLLLKRLNLVTRCAH